MYKLITIFIGMIAFIVSFWVPWVAWIVLALPLAWFYLTYFSVRRVEIDYVWELSPAANEMFQKFYHFYRLPFGGSDISASASFITLCSIAIGVVGLFKSFWWGVLVAFVVYSLAAFIARQFNPTNFLVDENERLAHNEVVAWLRDDSA